MISKEDALKLVLNTSKYAHVLIASAIMCKLAARLGENSREWELVGLLHDLDFDEVGGDMSKHGLVAAERLVGKLSEKCLYATIIELGSGLTASSTVRLLRLTR
jgi:predicted hydrolase (HD superfamily)